ncbi:inactive polyglycylase TTLL10 [Mauremys reevesii]|uniref:inactive polyglycylase TTLL10 n=1 Tax=Mauremys reevesii TaxID=260615 RepID=UPI00193F5878|nr:inactive polyglycylase TTLL10 [Mauremys reevesii]
MKSGRKRNCCFMVYLEGLDQEKNEKEIETVSIQKAFQKFRRKRQEELQMLRGKKLSIQSRLQDPDYRWQLRMKFLEQAKSYIGVPYAKKYHEPGTPEYESPFFLDCCGLIRRVVRDLQSEFGFCIGPGNQAYQYDTLPITLPSEEHMKPGDLIFISGTYFDPERRRQFHDIVHVEIWLGSGERSLGARWKRGRLQIFDSYRFVSPSYRDMEYHFKSIETWLQGTCVSHCPEHKWASVRELPGRKSVFYPEAEQQEPADDDGGGMEKEGEMQLKNEDTAPRSQGMAQDIMRRTRLRKSTHIIVVDLQGIPRTESNVTREDEVEGGLDTEASKSRGQSPASMLLDSNLTKPDLESSNCAHPDGNVGQDKGSEKAQEPKTATKVASQASQANDSKENSIGLKPSQIIHDSGVIAENAPSSSKLNSKGTLATSKRKKGTKSMTKEGAKQLVGSSAADTAASSASEVELVDEAKSKIDQPEDKKLEEPQSSGPFFYIGGANGAGLVSVYCRSKGWQRIHDNKREDYKLKWCETKSRETYYNFKEGEQLLYQIPNNKVLTTKIGLLSNLREYERVMNKISKHLNAKILKMEDFFPESFRLDIKDEREAFFELYKDKQIWICKPTCSNQGRGIFLLKNQAGVNSLQAKLQSIEEDPLYKKVPYKAPQARIVQRYIQKPLLLEGKKFDVRSYLLIACTVPYVLFFGHGYVRLTCTHYDATSDDLTAHLTNQYMQKKNPLYSQLKEETVWRMERFNSYVNDKFRQAKALPKDWVFTVFTKRMQQIMMQCFLAVKSKLECKLGYFDLIGCDFLIDEDFKVWLLEMNANPALHTNCAVLQDVIPTVVNGTLDLALEIFNKSLKGQRILPLRTQCHFVLLHNGSTSEAGLRSPKTRNALGISRNQRSLTESTSHLARHPLKAAEKPPKKPSDSGENTNSPPQKVSQRTVLTMPQVQITGIHSIYACHPFNPTARSGQVSGTCSQYIIRPLTFSAEGSMAKHSTDDGSEKDMAGTIVPTAAASKETAYGVWLQQTFGIKYPTSTNEDPAFISSQMVSLHLQSKVSGSSPCLGGHSKPLYQPLTHPTAKEAPSTSDSKAVAVSQGAGPPPDDQKKVSHRGS